MAHVRIRTCPSGKTFCIIRRLLHLPVPILAVDGVCKNPCMSHATCLIGHKKEVLWLCKGSGESFLFPLKFVYLEIAALGPWHDVGLLRQCPKSLWKLPHEAGIRSRQQGSFILNLTLFLPVTLFLGNKIRSLWSTSFFSLFTLMLAWLTVPLERWVKRN